MDDVSLRCCCYKTVVRRNVVERMVTMCYVLSKSFNLLGKWGIRRPVKTGLDGL